MRVRSGRWVPFIAVHDDQIVYLVWLYVLIDTPRTRGSHPIHRRGAITSTHCPSFFSLTEVISTELHFTRCLPARETSAAAYLANQVSTTDGCAPDFRQALRDSGWNESNGMNFRRSQCLCDMQARLAIETGAFNLSLIFRIRLEGALTHVGLALTRATKVPISF